MKKLFTALTCSVLSISYALASSSSSDLSDFQNDQKSSSTRFSGASSAFDLSNEELAQIRVTLAKDLESFMADMRKILKKLDFVMYDLNEDLSKEMLNEDIDAWLHELGMEAESKHTNVLPKVLTVVNITTFDTAESVIPAKKAVKEVMLAICESMDLKPREDMTAKELMDFVSNRLKYKYGV